MFSKNESPKNSSRSEFGTDPSDWRFPSGRTYLFRSSWSFQSESRVCFNSLRSLSLNGLLSSEAFVPPGSFWRFCGSQEFVQFHCFSFSPPEAPFSRCSGFHSSFFSLFPSGFLSSFSSSFFGFSSSFFVFSSSFFFSCSSVFRFSFSFSSSSSFFTIS